jgi:hypothetical protein
MASNGIIAGRIIPAICLGQGTLFVGASFGALWIFDATSSHLRLPHVESMGKSAIEEAEKAGFDLTLVDASLMLTPEQRAKQHDQALSLVLEFDRIRKERSEQPQPITPAAR